jgi:hypothetical protein
VDERRCSEFVVAGHAAADVPSCNAFFNRPGYSSSSRHFPAASPAARASRSVRVPAWIIFSTCATTMPRAVAFVGFSARVAV